MGLAVVLYEDVQRPNGEYDWSLILKSAWHTNIPHANINYLPKTSILNNEDIGDH